MIKQVKQIAILVIFLVTMSLMIFAANISPITITQLERPIIRHEVMVPNVEEFITLKCDFHMHTVFSDGRVWPDLRVIEAWATGLDAIAITDHIENGRSRPFLTGDDNSSYEVAQSAGEWYGIILIKGGEITRDEPYGHYNALFLKDVNLVDNEDPFTAIENAVKQGAFIQWNHPDWNSATRNQFKFQKKLLEKGYLHGVEISNGSDWYPHVIDWALENNLTMMGNSDLHGLIMGEFQLDKFQRPMTLVFAKEKTEQGIREALDNKRTVVWIADLINGREEWVSKLFLSCVHFGKIRITNPKKKEGQMQIENVSDIPWSLKLIGPVAEGTYRLEPRSSLLVRTRGEGNTKVIVTNAWVKTGTNLQLEMNLE
ncbi:MAG: Sb-PDE family phosphodiesterase [Candidatus Hydrogenedens sp.]